MPMISLRVPEKRLLTLAKQTQTSKVRLHSDIRIIGFSQEMSTTHGYRIVYPWNCQLPLWTAGKLQNQNQKLTVGGQ